MTTRPTSRDDDRALWRDETGGYGNSNLVGSNRSGLDATRQQDRDVAAERAAMADEDDEPTPLGDALAGRDSALPGPTIVTPQAPTAGAGDDARLGAGLDSVVGASARESGALPVDDRALRSNDAAD